MDASVSSLTVEEGDNRGIESYENQLEVRDALILALSRRAAAQNAAEPQNGSVSNVATSDNWGIETFSN